MKAEIADVGNEWGEVTETAPAAQEGIQEVKEEAPEFQDNLLADAEEAPAEKKEEAPSAESFVEVKGGGKTGKFNLNPSDPTLLKTLQHGLQAQTYLRQRDDARTKLRASQEERGPLKEAKEAWDTIGEYLEHGQYEAVVRAVLRDKYEEYEKQRTALEGASADERWDFEKKQIEAQRAIERKQFERELAGEREKLTKREEAALETRLESSATREFNKYSFKEFGLSDDLQQQLSEELWEGAWNMVDRYITSRGASPKDVTQDMLSKAFERRYARLTAAFKVAGEKQAASIIETKKQEAKQQIRAAATERYPQASPVAQAKGWSGRSAAELTRKLLGR